MIIEELDKETRVSCFSHDDHRYITGIVVKLMCAKNISKREALEIVAKDFITST